MNPINSLIILSLVAFNIFLPSAAGQGFEENFLIVFPSFTDTTAIENWRSWVCITNPWNQIANGRIYIYNQYGISIGEQPVTLYPGASYFVRPRNIVGYDCSGSAAVLSDIPVVGMLEKSRNNNQMTNAYNGFFWDLRPEAQSSSQSWSAIPQMTSRS